MSSYKIIFDEDAKKDLYSHLIYYYKIDKKLGKRFYLLVKKTVSPLSRHPRMAQIRYKNVHTLPVNGFPFLIHFIIDDLLKHVKIIAIIHTSSNPNNWPDI